MGIFMSASGSGENVLATVVGRAILGGVAVAIRGLSLTGMVAFGG